jgi:hypothetical protein
VNPDLPTIELKLWRADAIVLFDWLHRVDLNTVEIDHPAEKQARLEQETDIPYGSSGTGLTQDEIDLDLLGAQPVIFVTSFQAAVPSLAWSM